MTEKILNSRIVNKHDSAENWSKAVNFTPKQGEIIVYDIDENYSYERIKIGDGSNNVNSLPFVDGALRTELLAQIGEISTLVGDKKVSDQINTAIINKADAPKLTNVSILASSWTGESNPWSQVVTINGVTHKSKIDLQPTALQIVELQDNDIALIAENTNGIVTIYALGSKPTKDYTMQALITEVVVV
jgi:hypothetical protein